jgi:hypothetical protein
MLALQQRVRALVHEFRRTQQIGCTFPVTGNAEMMYLASQESNVWKYFEDVIDGRL